MYVSSTNYTKKMEVLTDTLQCVDNKMVNVV